MMTALLPSTYHHVDGSGRSDWTHINPGSHLLSECPDSLMLLVVYALPLNIDTFEYLLARLCTVQCNSMNEYRYDVCRVLEA